MGFQRMLILVPVLLTIVATAEAQAKPGCQDSCGALQIPYPFGTGAGCFLNEGFLITCNDSKSFLRKSNILVTDLSIDGQLHVLNYVDEKCYDREGTSLVPTRPSYISLSKFTISNTQNRFTVIGCDSYAYITGDIGSNRYRTGCISWCDRKDSVINGSCSGTGCCQIEIPKGLRTITVGAYSFKNHINVSEFNPCTYAFVVEQDKFTFSSTYLQNLAQTSFPMVLDWAIDGSCEVAAKHTSIYACKENSECLNILPAHNSSVGYRCSCKDGYRGNPYLSNYTGGCQDINECNEGRHECEHVCVNSGGNYTCECKIGYRGHGDRRIHGDSCVLNPLPRNPFPLINIILGVVMSLVVLVVGSSWIYLVLKKRKLMKLKENFFQQNGGFLLRKQLSERTEQSSDTAKIFTAEELKKATHNFDEDRVIGRGGYGTVYKGTLTESDNYKVVAIKKSKFIDRSQIDQFINEVVILSQINHRNVVKLLGCCLETEVPLLVYEFVTNGTLFDYIHDDDKSTSISWETRLRIAAETAGVLYYLHSGASTPIIHRDVKSTNILLDDNYTAKVSDFGASKLVPMDETQLSTLVQGTIGYLDPEYLHTGQLTEKSDVYSFGVVLVELLTGRKAVSFDMCEKDRCLVICFLTCLKNGGLFEMIENHIVNDRNVKELKEVSQLAARCLNVKGEERPTMKEVAMELEGWRMMHNLDNVVELNSEEAESLLFETTSSDAYNLCGDGSNSSTGGYDSMKISQHPLLALDHDGR